MGEHTIRITLSLIGPGILSVFGVVFVCAWLIERKRHYLLLLATACGLFAFGSTIQIFYWPSDTGLNALLSGAFYTLAVIMACEGILVRSGRRLGVRFDLAFFLVMVLLVWFYFYVERSVVARVYVQNFGYGLVMLLTAWRLRVLAAGRYVDRALFWILLIFALQFFPRTVLTIGLSGPVEPRAFGESAFWQTLQLSLAILGASLAFAILSAAIADLIEDLRNERDLDPLTGVLNRRGFDDRAAPLFGQDHPVVLVLCDLDHFKRINDAFGHDAGDEVLRRFGRLLRQGARSTDLVGRIGGEEFAIVLEDVNREVAIRFAERLRHAITGERFAFGDEGLFVTVSIGLAERKPDDTLRRLMKRADRRLYEAKSKGRNRLIAFGDVVLQPDNVEIPAIGMSLAGRQAS